jgi:hypothetical protein
VNSTGSGTSGSGTSGTLPYVISQANANTNSDGSEITFDPTFFSTQQTIDVEATLVLSETSGSEVIEGPEAGSLFHAKSAESPVISIARRSRQER